MNYEQYNTAERTNYVRLVAVLIAVLRPFQPILLTPSLWRSIVTLLYPYVEDARTESSRLAREFYDAERDRQLGTLIDLDAFRDERNVLAATIDIPTPADRHDIDLAPYKPGWFHEAMQPAREKFSRENASESDLATAAGIAGKEALNGGRSTIRNAVVSDSRAFGWARVAGGGESCAFCEMLISRGPVYNDVNDAGLNADSNESALAIWREFDRTGNEDKIMSLMNRWHENCDCRVVPVFRGSKDWPGKDAADRALEAWNAATKDFTGRDKLNAFRRYMRDGYKDTSLAA